MSTYSQPGDLCHCKSKVRSVKTASSTALVVARRRLPNPDRLTSTVVDIYIYIYIYEYKIYKS